MKGLFIKDLRLLLQQKIFLVILVSCMAIMVINGVGDIAFFMGYIPMLAIILIAGTISYDEIDNGYAFLFTLPVSRREYVVSKYILEMVSCLLAGILSAGTCGIVLKGDSMSWVEIAQIAGLVFAICIAGISILIPMILKCGAERSRLYIFAFIGIVFGGMMLINKLVEYLSIDTQKMVNVFTQLSASFLVIVGVLLVIALLILSIIISIRIMEKKEF